MSSFLRWAGSKKKLLIELEGYLPPKFKRYVEPFAGSACLFFSAKPSSALLADVNADLILTYQSVQNESKDVAKRLARMPINEDFYYRLRRRCPTSLSRPARAARFIYLNRFCFNGLFRTNKAGEFNVPYGGTSGGQLPSSADLLAAATLLANAKLETWDFEQTLSEVKPGDFVYMDPPYSVGSRRVFRQYSSADFGASQLGSLKKWMARLDKRGIPFLVSYADSREARELAIGFHSRVVLTRRNIAGFHSHRKNARECLISNY